MKKFLSIGIVALTTAIAATSQIADPILMMINGKPVSRSEFEYSYNKNNNSEGTVEKKTIDEYVDMFINYKLKVEAAEEMHLDTLSSFNNEFLGYRDMQLTPFFIDSAYIDSTAMDVYRRTKEQLGDKELLRPAHILLRVSSSAGEAEKNKVKERIDSIFNALKGGADFAKMASALSQDFGSARNGGLLPWIGPNSTLKEFETAAYALKVGEMSKPFLSPVGYHIILMKDRKPLDSYETLRPEILTMLNRQGISEQASESKLRKLQASTGLSREAILTQKMNEETAKNENLKYLIKEYHDGLLLYEASKRNIWDVAAKDSIAIEKYFKKNKKNYKWTEPRFKGVLFLCKEEALIPQVKETIKKNQKGDWRTIVQHTFNKDSVKQLIIGLPGIFKKGDNPYVDQLFFKSGTAKPQSEYPYAGIYGEKLSQPQTAQDVKTLVTNDYQDLLEKNWVDQLRKHFTFTVDKNVLQTVNKH